MRCQIFTQHWKHFHAFIEACKSAKTVIVFYRQKKIKGFLEMDIIFVFALGGLWSWMVNLTLSLWRRMSDLTLTLHHISIKFVLMFYILTMIMWNKRIWHPVYDDNWRRQRQHVSTYISLVFPCHGQEERFNKTSERYEGNTILYHAD